MLEDKGLDDPIFKDTNCFKKHLKTFIFLIIGIIVITVVIVLIIVLTKDDKPKEEDPKEPKEEDPKEETRPFEYGLTMEKLKRKTDPDYMYHFVLYILLLERVIKKL